MSHKKTLERWLQWESRETPELNWLRDNNELFNDLMATTSVFMTQKSRLAQLTALNQQVVEEVLAIEDEGLQRFLLGERYDGYVTGCGGEGYDLDTGVITRLVGYQFFALRNRPELVQAAASGLLKVFRAAQVVNGDDEVLSTIRGNLTAYAEYFAHDK